MLPAFRCHVSPGIDLVLPWDFLLHRLPISNPDQTVNTKPICPDAAVRLMQWNRFGMSFSLPFFICIYILSFFFCFYLDSFLFFFVPNSGWVCCWLQSFFPCLRKWQYLLSTVDLCCFFLAKFDLSFFLFLFPVNLFHSFFFIILFLSSFFILYFDHCPPLAFTFGLFPFFFHFEFFFFFFTSSDLVIYNCLFCSFCPFFTNDPF